MTGVRGPEVSKGSMSVWEKKYVFLLKYFLVIKSSPKVPGNRKQVSWKQDNLAASKQNRKEEEEPQARCLSIYCSFVINLPRTGVLCGHVNCTVALVINFLRVVNFHFCMAVCYPCCLLPLFSMQPLYACISYRVIACRLHRRMWCL